MKRDLDLCRRILLAVEESDHDPHEYMELDFWHDYPDGSVSYQVMLLDEEGLVEAVRLNTIGTRSPYGWFPKRLTASGHNFLDASRNDDIWNEGKRRANEVGTASLPVVLELLLHIAREKLGI